MGASWAAVLPGKRENSGAGWLRAAWLHHFPLHPAPLLAHGLQEAPRWHQEELACKSQGLLISHHFISWQFHASPLPPFTSCPWRWCFSSVKTGFKRVVSTCLSFWPPPSPPVPTTFFSDPATNNYFLGFLCNLLLVQTWVSITRKRWKFLRMQLCLFTE